MLFIVIRLLSQTVSLWSYAPKRFGSCINFGTYSTGRSADTIRCVVNAKNTIRWHTQQHVIPERAVLHQSISPRRPWDGRASTPGRPTHTRIPHGRRLIGKMAFRLTATSPRSREAAGVKACDWVSREAAGGKACDWATETRQGFQAGTSLRLSSLHTTGTVPWRGQK